jgi:hypothetical protein
MRVRCPDCRSVYEIDLEDEDVILVCHRCQAEFEPDGKTIIKTEPDQTGTRIQPAESDAQVALDQQTYREELEDLPPEPSIDRDDSSPEENHPPEDKGGSVISTEESDTETPLTTPVEDQGRWRRTAFRPGWKALIAAFIIFSGLWLTVDTWMEKPWTRSFLLNSGFKSRVLHKDWQILPDYVQAQWVVRRDQSLVLVIKGKVENLLQSTLPPPAIKVSMYADEVPDKALKEFTWFMTLQPMGDAIQRSPYIPPPENTLPVLPGGAREFTMVLEDVPAGATRFSLDAVPRQP